ncbi:Hpt domain-containing protein [Candidatus Nitrospira bockiana]
MINEAGGQGPAPADFDAALARLDGDEALLRELIDLFLHDCPRLTRTLHDALRRSDAQGVRAAAHTLKGSLKEVSAPAAVQAAYALELMGSANDWTGVDAAVAALDDALARLIPTLERWLHSAP